MPLHIGKSAKSSYEQMLAKATGSDPESATPPPPEEDISTVTLPPDVYENWKKLMEGVDRRNMKIIETYAQELDGIFSPEEEGDTETESESVPPSGKEPLM